MSDDDDTGHHHSKIAAVETAAKTKYALPLWVVVALVLVAFGLGLWAGK